MALYHNVFPEKFMKGYGMFSVGNHGWMDHPKPVAGPLDAIVRPTYLAPCSSDTHCMHGGAGPMTDCIMGHEAIGEVVEVGSLVKNFKPGDVVVVPANSPDWTAPGVQHGFGQHEYHAMSGMKFVLSKDGVFAEFFHVNHADSNMVLLPPSIDPWAALMTVDMMSTGFHGVDRAEVNFGDVAVVMGVGPVGLSAVAACKLRGAGRIIVVETETRAKRIALAKEYGATDSVDFEKGNPAELVRALCPEGVDAVIICGGTADNLRYAMEMTRPGGVVSTVNFFDVTEVFTFPSLSWALGMNDVSLRAGFCRGGAERLRRLLNVIQYGRFDPSKMVTHRFEGFEKIEDAFLLMERKPADMIKPGVHIKW